MAKFGRIKSYRAGDSISATGDKTGAMYVVLAGTVNLYDAPGISPSAAAVMYAPVAKLSVGDYWGEMSAFAGLPCPYSAVSEFNSLVAEVTAPELPAFIGDYPEMAARIMVAMALKIQPAQEPVPKPAPESAPEQKASVTHDDTMSAELEEILSIINEDAVEKTVKKAACEAEHKVATPVTAAEPKPVTASEPEPEPEHEGALVWNISDYEKQRPGSRALLSFAPVPETECYITPAPESHDKVLNSKRFTCPVCENQFNQSVPLNFKLSTKSIGRDLRILHVELDTVWYGVIVCPQCNYANLQQFFESLESFDAETLKNSNYESAPRFEGFSQNRTLGEVIKSYQTALTCTNAYTREILRMAQLWRRLAWLYQDAGDTPRWVMAREQARNCYQETLSRTRLKKEEEQQLRIILGELYHQEEDYNNAYKQFSEILKLGKTVGIRLYDQAVDSIQSLREEREAKKQSEKS